MLRFLVGMLRIAKGRLRSMPISISQRVKRRRLKKLPRLVRGRLFGSSVGLPGRFTGINTPYQLVSIAGEYVPRKATTKGF